MKNALKVLNFSTTPGFIRAAIVAIIALVVTFAWTGYNAVQHSQTTIHSISNTAIPSIVGAKSISARLLEMDANATNEFLAGANASGESARKRYEELRKEIAQDLVSASERLSPGALQRKSVEGMLEKLQDYAGMIESARANNRQGFPVGAAYLRQASRLLHNDILIQAKHLDEHSHDTLYVLLKQHNQVVSTGNNYLMLSGGALLVVLIGLQIYLSNRTRRTFNLGLLTTSILVTATLVYTNLTIRASDHTLSAAHKNEFVSVYSLWQIRATIYDAKADQSLYLIARGNNAAYEKSLNDKLRSLADEISTQAKASSVQKLLDEVRSAHRDFTLLDARIRELDKAGKRQEAVDLSIGKGSIETFNRLSKAISSPLEHAQSMLNGEIQASAARTALLGYVFIILAFLVMVMTILGLRPRLNEYRA